MNELNYYKILAYNTRRYHTIACENMEVLTQICSNRFRYTPIWNRDGLTFEPNWQIIAINSNIGE